MALAAMTVLVFSGSVRGAFTLTGVVVNPGTNDIHFTPPTGSSGAATETKEVTGAANGNLGTTTLHPGFLVSGTVRSVGGGFMRRPRQPLGR